MASEEYGISGHGYIVSIEEDPVGAPDTYTPVGGLSSDVVHNWSREFTATLSHNMGVDGGVVSNVITRGDIVLENNYIPGGQHDTVIRQHFKDNLEFKVQMRGPGGSAGNDEVIQTGKITNIEFRAPIGTGARVMAWTFRPIGPFEVDGETYE
jgi:hypothetical protein